MVVSAGYGSPIVSRTPVATEPTVGYRIVMKPEYYTVKRSVCTTEYQDDVRHRVVTSHRIEPLVEDRKRVRCDWKTVTKSKTIEYQKTVQEVTYKDHTFTTTVPVWSTEEYAYTVKVPKLVDSTETYYVSEPQVVDEPFTYTVRVPYPVTETRFRTITNVIPVTKSRTVQHCVPVPRTEQVTKDYGHWEMQVVEVAGGHGRGDCGGCSSGCGGGCGDCTAGCAGCGGCGCQNYSNGCGAQTVTRRVWVPNVRTEEQTVIDHQVQTQEVQYTVYEQHQEQVPYECTFLEYQSEERVGTKKKVVYQKVPRERTVKVVQYTDEPRTGTKKVLTYETETKTEKYPVISYRTEPATKEITWEEREPVYTVEDYQVTSQQRVEDKHIESYDVRVPVPAVKEVEVQFCKMVPTVVEVTLSACGSSANAGGYGGQPVGDCGCQNAPAVSSDCGCG
jgi:hypothetical protein